jgi:hypothetical protein
MVGVCPLRSVIGYYKPPDPTDMPSQTPIGKNPDGTTERLVNRCRRGVESTNSTGIFEPAVNTIEALLP